MALILCFLLLIPVEGLTLGVNYEYALEKQLRLIIAKHPRYVWGGAESEEKGLDCSGYIYLASRRAALPVSRQTAFGMALNRGGWISAPILFRDTRELDIVWWTFSKDRPNGHVGVLIKHPRTCLPAVTHASSKRGVITDYLSGSLFRDISRTKRLTIGDP
jgi:hypothetical protein